MKALRIVLAALAGVIALLAIAAIVIVRSFDLNDYKDEITAFVQERTGRTLTIDDNIEFSLFPWFAVETGGVSLSDDPGFADRSFVDIDRLSARVRVWPLLKRRIEIGRVILDGIDVNLGMDAEGRGNWATLLESPAPEAAPAETETPESPAINAIAVEGIELRNARILWHDPNDEVVYVVRDLTLVTGPVNDSAPIDLSLSLSLLDVASQASAAIELETVATIRPAIQLRNIEAELRLLDARAQERAAASLTFDSISLDGSALRSGPARIAATLRQPPIGPDALELDARFASLDLDAGSETFIVDGLTASTGGIGASVNLTGASMLSDPRLTGTVSLRSATLAALLETAGAVAPEDLAAPAMGGFTADARFDLGLTAGTFTIESYTAALLGLNATGKAGLAADGSLTASVALAPFRPTEPLLALLGNRLPDGVDLRAVSTASLTASLRRAAGAAGLDVGAFVLNLDGARLEGSLSIDDISAPGRIGGKLAAAGLDNRLLGALFGTWLPAALVDTNLGQFRLATDFDYELATGAAAFAPLELTAYGLSGDGQLSLVYSDDTLALSGRAALAEFSPRQLLSRFDLPVPQTSDPTVFRSAELAASFETTGDHGEFRDIAIELDDSRITGEFSVENFADPEYRFLLRADRIDADRYLPPKAPDAATPTAGGEKHLGDLRLASEPLTATNVTGTASVGRLRIGGMDFEQLSADVAFGHGLANLSSVRTALYGGSFAGGLTVDATGDSGLVHLTGDLAGVELRPLLTAMLGEAALGGTGKVGLDLTGRGDTISDALHTAEEKMSLALADGQIDGFNLDWTFCAAFNLRERLAPPAAAPKLTRYAEIRAEATVRDGIASTPNLYARTEHFESAGPGAVSLSDGRVDYDLRATLASPVTIAGCDRINSQVGNSFPYTIKGVLPAVDVRPDLGEYLRDRIIDETRDRILNRLLN